MGLLKTESCHYNSVHVGEVLHHLSDDEREKVQDEETADEDMKDNQPISSPIRLTPERRESSGRIRHHVLKSSGTDNPKEEKNPRLPVRDRLYLSKTAIGVHSSCTIICVSSLIWPVVFLVFLSGHCL